MWKEFAPAHHALTTGHNIAWNDVNILTTYQMKLQVPDPQNVGDPQNAGLGSGTSRQQNSHVEVNVLLSA